MTSRMRQDPNDYFSGVRDRPRGHGYWAWPLRPMLRAMLKRKLKRCGERARFDPFTSTFAGIRYISLGDDVFIGPRALISADGVDVSIGDDTIIGPALLILAGDHRFDRPGELYREHQGRGDNGPVAIGCNVWIGSRVLVLKGVRIGDGSVIAAGSVVTEDIPELSVAAGVPAKVVRPRFTGEERVLHLARMRGLWGSVRIRP